MQFHTKTAEECIRELGTDRESGLKESQLIQLSEVHGKNELAEKKKKSVFMKFIDQFKDVMILILIAAAAISFTLACIEAAQHGHGEFFEPILILVIVILNAVMGVIQEGKAEKALDALKGMSAQNARVVRDGKEHIINAKDLVPGDIIKLEAGDFVPADARLLSSVSLKSEEAALTGESVPSEKDAAVAVAPDAPLGDRHNMVFSGCSITYGTATAVVTATGMNTEMGKIANLLDSAAETETPLQKKLAQLGKYLGILALACCAVIFAVGIASGNDILDIFMTSVSLAVSAIPEGLPAIVTIVLSIGVQRMVKRNALIRKLPAVETLGGASVICSDKTGTLTQNRMTLVKSYTDTDGALSDIGAGNDVQNKLLKYATLCCDGSVIFDGEEVKHIGDPTETAIVFASHMAGMPKDSLNLENPRIAELPFDSDRKLMTTVNVIDGRPVVITKGAFDVMASITVKGDIDKAASMNEQMSRDALRVIAVGYKEIDALPENISCETLESGLTFLGLVGMIDPPRPEVRVAVATCRDAGIKPVMITGDHVVTASAIAKDLGILEDGDMAITGAELDRMTDAQLDENVENISVYARVSPENKIRIVKAWQRKDRVVAMTGDGVNDAPALKAADIGCAMGITGTDVAKGASDMVLTDDNFSTIVEAVREGRGIYDNIKKVIGFLLGTNIGEVITVFMAMIIGAIFLGAAHSPLLSMQLLWINLVTDSLPAIALGMEAVDKNIMKKHPKPKNEGIFAHGLGVKVVIQGVMFAALTLAGYYIGQYAALGGISPSEKAGQTMAFFILALCQIVQAYNMRSEHSLFKIGPFGNKNLNLASITSVILVALVMFVPGLNTVFGLIYLSWQHYLIGLCLIFVPLLVMEIAKAVSSARSKR